MKGIVILKKLEGEILVKYPKSDLQPDRDAVYCNGIRVLVPADYDSLKGAIPKKHHKATFELSTITGMRWAELRRFYDHPEWYSEKRNQIKLPAEAQRKVHQVQKERTVDLLPSSMPYILDAFFEGPQPPTLQSWNESVKRWSVAAGLNPFGMSAKVSRKTCECWMLAAGVPPFRVYKRQGHDPATSMRHYQEISFTDPELRDIEKRLQEWGMLRAW